MQPSIRPAGPDDREAVVALAGRLTEGVAPWRDADAVRRSVEAWVLSALDDAAVAALVAVVDGTVVGFVSLSTTEHFAGETDAYIGELIVAAPFEGRGIGAALVDAAEREARARGHRCLTLTTGAANHRALRFYERCGFGAEDVKLTRVLRD